MSEVDWVNVAGCGASLLVFCAFYMKAMIPLRAVAIASNIAFITYGLGRRLYPVLILHAVLLPLNCLRLQRLRAVTRRVRDQSGHIPSIDGLIPLMTRHQFKSGDALFRIGDPASSMCLILTGSVRVDLVHIGNPG